MGWALAIGLYLERSNVHHKLILVKRYTDSKILDLHLVFSYFQPTIVHYLY